MSLGACIPGMVERGEMTPEQGEEMRALYDDITAQLLREHGQDQAAALASQQTLNQMEKAAARKRELAGITILKRQSQLADMNSFNGGRPEGEPIDPRSGPAFQNADGRASYSNLNGRAGAIFRRANRYMDKILAEFSSNVIGLVRNKANMMDMLKEIFGEDSGNIAAKEMAEAWKKTHEYVRARYNAAGGAIAYLKDWGLPQFHNWRTIRDAGFQAWHDFLMRDGMIDRDKMFSKRTGLPMTDAELTEGLHAMFLNGATDGAIGREVGEGRGGRGSLANKGQESRFLMFKSAEAWDAYASRYGRGNAFDVMLHHIDQMSHDIAAMEIFGPNPQTGYDFIRNVIKNSADNDLRPENKSKELATRALIQMDRMWNEYNGTWRSPEYAPLAQAAKNVRGVLTAAHMAGATIAALSDTAFQFSTRVYNGLPWAGMLSQYGRYMASADAQGFAVRAGLISRDWRWRASADYRFANETLTGEKIARTAESVLRLSMLNNWTQAGRHAFGEELLGFLTSQSVNRFDKLEPAFRSMMERNGLGEAEWDQIRRTPLEMDRGVPWLFPHNVENQALGDRLLEIMDGETDMAVPSPDLNTRAMMNAVARPGSIMGELVKSETLFKGFGISAAVMQGRRIMQMSLGNMAKYTAGLIASTTLVGAVINILNDIRGGNDPSRMFDQDGRLDYKFWGAATLAGGGWFTAGDFLRSAESRYGGGILGWAAGPVLEDANQAINIPQTGWLDRATAAAKGQGEWGDVAGQGWQGRAFKFARNELPGGSLWYGRLALDRMVADQLQMAVDPQYGESWNRTAKYAADRGTQSFWAPGDPIDKARAPNFANVGKPSSDPEVLFGLK